MEPLSRSVDAACTTLGVGDRPTPEAHGSGSDTYERESGHVLVEHGTSSFRRNKPEQSSSAFPALQCTGTPSDTLSFSRI